MKENCPHCGQSVMKHKHSLSLAMVETLAKSLSGDFHLRKDLNLTKNEYHNFQKLKYFKLVEMTGKAGYWKLSDKGSLFLSGKLSVPKWVQTFNNKVTDWSSDRILRQDIDVDFHWKKIEDYRTDAEPAFPQDDLFRGGR
jgi:hypothetical protein